MKRTFILSIVAAAFIALTFSSYTAGTAQGGAGNVTGTGCNSGTGCHGANSTHTAVGIVLTDKVTGQTVSDFRYVPGRSYTLQLRGESSTGIIKYGFQISAVQKASLTTQAGVFSNYPGNNTVHSITVSGLQIIEHSKVLTGKLGGTSNTTGIDSVLMDWKAPNAGAGTVRFRYMLNSVNGDGTSAGDEWNGSVSDFDPAPVAVDDVALNPIAALFPVPAKDVLFVSMKKTGRFAIQITDAAGRIVQMQIVENAGITPIALPVNALPAGVYHLLLHGAGCAQSVAFTKQ